MQLKKDNNDLRESLKTLNEKLTVTLEKLKVRSFKQTEVPKTKVETLERELLNAKKKMNSYNKEIDFLAARLDQGDQIERINNLQEMLFKKSMDEENFKKQLRSKSQIAKISEKQVKGVKDDVDHNQRVRLICMGINFEDQLCD